MKKIFPKIVACKNSQEMDGQTTAIIMFNVIIQSFSPYAVVIHMSEIIYY